MTGQKKYSTEDLEKLVNDAQVTKQGPKDGPPAEATVTLTQAERPAKKQEPEVPRQMAQIPNVTRDTMGDTARPAPVKAILPSRGLYYGSDSKFGSNQTISNGEIWIRPWTFKEQKMFLKPEIIQSGSLIDAILYSCIATGGVDITRLLSSDRTYLFWFARSLTYGDDYEYPWICQNRFCTKRENHNKINVGELAVVWANDEIEEPIPYTLSSGEDVEVRFARGYDENASIAETLKKENDRVVKANPHAKIESFDESDEELDRLKLLVVSIDGNTDRLHISKKIDSMVAGDVSEIQSLINEYESGIEREVTHTCSACKTQVKTEVPLEAEFFRRSLRK